MEKKKLTIYVDLEVRKALKILVAERETSVSALVNELLKRELERKPTKKII